MTVTDRCPFYREVVWSNMAPYWHVSLRVSQAIASGLPVVALESSIFTQGLPVPRNLEVALEAERILRAAGVEPATVGVYHGRPTIGLDEAQIDELAYEPGILKASDRDLPFGAINKRNAGTTVAATAYLAHLAGIKVFATGGLGGVHYGADHTFDESADLSTLAQTPLVVVSSGVKTMLDVRATLERLETLSVPIVGYGTDCYPGFYATDSGRKLRHRVDTPAHVAALYNAQRALDMKSALLVANPIPTANQVMPDVLEDAIVAAQQAIAENNIEGPDVTPYLIEHLRQGTNGVSLEANIALYLNNVRVAALIAKELAG